MYSQGLRLMFSCSHFFSFFFFYSTSTNLGLAVANFHECRSYNFHECRSYLQYDRHSWKKLYVKPDAIIISGTKLGPDIASSQFMPCGYAKPYRKDRKAGAGGVLVAIRDCYTSVEVELPHNQGETIWCEVNMKQGRKLYMGASYRTPSGNPVEQLDHLEKSLQDLKEITRDRRDVTVV